MSVSVKDETVRAQSYGHEQLEDSIDIEPKGMSHGKDKVMGGANFRENM